MKLTEFISNIKNHSEFGSAYVYHRLLPRVEAAYGPDLDLPPDISDILKQQGIEKLFKHQVEAIEHIRRKENVLVATPTASGKSLIYNLTVLESLLQNKDKKALYLFPLKALEQDQLKNLSVFLKGIKQKKVNASIYDGDTTAYKRKQIRTQIPEIIFTNPDMLHRGILSHHENWEGLFENLAFVVLDEVHTYRGIFGTHMNQIVRRLKRVCALYGSSPQFILLSATINNPHEFGQSLIEEKVVVVDSSGSPRAGQGFLFLNPGASSNFSAAKLFVHCIESGFRTIAFTQSRKVTELIHVWVNRLSPTLRKKISSYRAGFMPGERRDIERKLANGDLMGVVSTSALEMGIDIGYLDICLLVGYPGTIINTWQRGGRVGRSGRESMVILVAKPDALDQYFMKHPDDFFERSYEAAIPSENPITLEDEAYWSKGLPQHLDDLEIEGELSRSAEGKPTWFATKQNPHLLVNIRSIGETYTIFERNTGEAIGTIGGSRALKECHPGAVYLHRAKQYLVDNLVLEKRDIIASQTDLNYFTRVLTEKETEIIHIHRSRPKAQFIVREGTVKVTEQVTGFEKRALPGQELMGTFTLDLPKQTFETIGFWIEIEPAIQRLVEEKNLHFMGGIHAIEHAAIGIFPLFALCDRNDIGGICYTHHPQIGKSAIFIYDGYPGGVGLAQRGFEIITELLERTLAHLNTCECEEGCPSCIHSPKCGNGNKPLDKGAAVMVLEFLLGKIPLSQFYDQDVEEQPGPLIEKKEGVVSEPSGPRVVSFDLETQKSAADVGGWHNTHLMRVSVAVIYDSLEDRFLSFREEEVDDLLDHLEKADLVVGFNIKKFDYGVLKAYTNKNLMDLPTFDILEDVYKRLGFRLGLDHLATETLDHGKTADGLQALEWFKQGEMKKLTEYCQQDVAVTRDLFQYCLDKSHLIYKTKKDDRRVRLRVDWNLDALLGK
jgi:DEAD/DEAH box helicase domain-containing protein